MGTFHLSKKLWLPPISSETYVQTGHLCSQSCLKTVHLASMLEFYSSIISNISIYWCVDKPNCGIHPVDGHSGFRGWGCNTELSQWQLELQWAQRRLAWAQKLRPWSLAHPHSPSTAQRQKPSWKIRSRILAVSETGCGLHRSALWKLSSQTFAIRDNSPVRRV